MHAVVIMVLWGVGGLVVLLVLAGVVLALLGRSIPVEHTASSEVKLPASADKVYALLDDMPAQATWASGVTKVDKLPDHHAMPAARVHMGRNSFVLVSTRRTPPNPASPDGRGVLERTIQDDHGAQFTGTWLYTITPGPDAGSCHVKLTETGRVRGAIPRAMMKHVFGYHLYINKHLASLAKKFGSTDTPRKA